MRTGLIIAATALVLSGTVTTAEARFRGGRSVHASRSGTAGIGGTGAGSRGLGVILPVGSPRSPATVPEERSATLRPILPVPAPVPARVRVRTAAPCADTRLVGSGAGFCELN